VPDQESRAFGLPYGTMDLTAGKTRIHARLVEGDLKGGEWRPCSNRLPVCDLEQH